MSEKKKKLTARQKKFIAAYDGNATEAAKKAGYSGTQRTLAVTGHEILRNPNVADALQERVEKEEKKLIASRADRQKFWTDIMMAAEAEMRDRLRASELLGKSEADFTEKVQVSVDESLAKRLDAARDRLKNNKEK